MHHPIEHFPEDRELEQALALLRVAQRVTVLTGAGVSAESGVPTFRGAGGLWEGHRIEDVATPRAFRRDPGLVWRFYNLRRASVWKVQPNPGHFALAEMEQRWGADSFAVCTQNVDGLHQQAGSQHVLELHGSLARVRCTVCAYRADRRGEDLPPLPSCPQCGELLRPDIVWFEEMLPADVWERAVEQTANCECFLVVGTSGVVYPAAGLIDGARAVGASIIEINLEATAATGRVDVALHGKSGEILPRLLAMLKGESGAAATGGIRA